MGLPEEPKTIVGLSNVSQSSPSRAKKFIEQGIPHYIAKSWPGCCHSRSIRHRANECSKDF
jgi:hypothetical protein